MSMRLRVVLRVILLALLFSTTVVLSYQRTVTLKSFKIGGNITYDCINIYKQPVFDQPFLKNHTIQLKPSVSRHESQVVNNKTYEKKKSCSRGTVPILRNPKNYNTNAKYFTEKFLHPLTIDTPGKHIAGLRSVSGPFHGVESYFGGYNLTIGQDQASYNQIFIGSGLNKEVNFISAGLMINPSHFGDGRVWTYGFWQGKDGKGCYNTACLGFVQVSHTIPIVKPFDIIPGRSWVRPFIHQDKVTGNWWLTYFTRENIYSDVGYWPKEVFNLLDNGANIAGVGGVVHASRSGSSPPMGTGRFPKKGYSRAAFRESSMFTNINVLDSNYKQCKINSFPIDYLVDSPKCYGLRIGKLRWDQFHSKLGFFFNYGGPGGDSCGI